MVTSYLPALIYGAQKNSEGWWSFAHFGGVVTSREPKKNDHSRFYTTQNKITYLPCYYVTVEQARLVK